MPQSRPAKLRKQYANTRFPTVVLRFEDGHEIRVRKGAGKAFDCFPGERVRVIALYDPSSEEGRELVETRRAEDFEDAAHA
ncbi:MAG: hypothetical protein ACJ8AO_22060 [Gemmatimonadaceae bacterium]